jgi:coproporphyrinogen III oxidase
MGKINKEEIAAWLKGLQDDICNSLEKLDGKGRFKEDLWNREEGGGGRTRIIEGKHIEKGGVNFSAVEGNLNPQAQKALELPSSDFFATGVSIVLHPQSPMVPIIHMNVRYFESGDVWWFGGGIDVTPHYINEADAVFFHKHLKSVCDSHHPDFYQKHKEWADDYFYIPHRKETRGIGGIFFDKITTPLLTKAQGFEYIKDVGKAFIPIYKQLFTNNIEKNWTEENKKWQLLRRGRYVEFNLVWDRGTKFGLLTDGRTESILMSLPSDAKWIYDYKVEIDSEEEKTMNMLKKGIDWVD